MGKGEEEGDRSSHPSSNGGHLPLPPQGAQVPLPLLPLPPPLLRLPHPPLRPTPPRPRRRPPPRRPPTRGGRRGGGVRLEALRVLRGGGLHTMLGQLEGDQGAAVAAAHGAPGAALPEAAAAVPGAPAGGVPDTGAVAEEQGHGEVASLIWYDNVPHSKLIEYKKDQNWVRRSGDYLVFPGGGTQFKEGVNKYIQFIEEMLPDIKWGKHVRVVLDVGCGVASFGGYLLEKSVITMSLAPKDEHEAQVQFALERGIPAVLSVIGTQRLNFPSNSFDVVHCARCRVHWDADGGLPVLELNRIIRPGGYFIWSATPVYRDNERDTNVWKAMVAITESICWQMVAKSVDSTEIGVVIYQKPLSNSCYKERGVEGPPFCDQKDIMNISWYTPLNYCLPLLPSSDLEYSWPKLWPDRLSSRPLSTELMMDSNSAESIEKDSKSWVNVISSVYFRQLGVNWSGVRNIMDMNAGYGGFAASLIDLPVWVMNVVPINGPDTLLSIFDRGLIGIYHDWCEAFNTYPRTYDLLHCSFLFGNITHRCDYVDLVVEMDRILRPGGWVIIRDSIEMIQKLVPVVRSLHWVSTVHEEKYLVSRKAFWRPLNGGSS